MLDEQQFQRKNSADRGYQSLTEVKTLGQMNS